jgi:multidrug efflux system outer membrane protein
MKRAIAALPLLALAACQTAPPFLAPQVPVPGQWGQQVAASAAAPALADRPWAEVFPVPELTVLIDEALGSSSELLVAVERVEIARAQLGLERAASLPSLNAAGAVSRQRAPAGSRSSNVVSEGASLSLVMPAWEVDLWGRLASRTEAARRELLANVALADGVRVSVAAEVSTRYLDLLDLDHQQAITQRTLDSRRHSLRLTRARFDEGVSSMLDVRQAESLVASSEQALADQRRRLSQTEHALSVLLGRNPGPIVRSVRLTDLAPPAQALAGLPSTLLQRRPDIRAAEESLRGAAANLDVARKAYLPSLTLTTLLGVASPGLGQLFDSGRHAWSVQPAVGLPIFDGGRLRAGIALAEAQQRILIEQYRATIRLAFREVNDALVSLEQLAIQRDASQRTVLAGQERLRITRARHLAGIASYFEVLDAERQLFDSEIGLSQLTRSHQQALVQLYLALGGGWRGLADADATPLPKLGQR